MVIPHVSRPVLYPDKRFQAMRMPATESFDHWGKFLEAILHRTPASAGFDYSGPLTEAVLLGGVASRFPQTTLKWDSEKLSFDLAEADQHVRQAYRPGWSVVGL
jgi:hypothetical protein